MVRHSRRAFLQTVGGSGLALAASAAPADETTRPRLSPGEVKDRVRGPILTMPTPFTADFQIDDAGIRRMIALGLANDVGVYELTAGNSQYDVLSEEEIQRLTRTVVEAVGGRGIVIAATGAWWTGQAVQYARFAESVGADALQVLLPPGSDAGYVQHFRRLADATKMPLLLQGALPLSLIEELVKIPYVVGMKEDGPDTYYVEVARRFGKRLAIFCGGQKRRYLIGRPHGSPAWFSFFITFAPVIAVRFRQAIEANDLETARDIVEKYEKPVFDFCSAGPRGFHAYWRALLEHFGVAQRYVRPPQESCNAEDLRKVAALCDRLGLVPGKEGSKPR
jgi:4-hydroxy-tetrahydrodipicolinate synthase